MLSICARAHVRKQARAHTHKFILIPISLQLPRSAIGSLAMWLCLIDVHQRSQQFYSFLLFSLRFLPIRLQGIASIRRTPGANCICKLGPTQMK